MFITRTFAPGLLASGQPSPEDLVELATRGVRTVINLRAMDEPLEYDEPGAVERLGLRYVSIPVAGPQDITIERVARFSRELSAAARLGGTLVHCASGNRVGALVALDQGLVQRAPGDRALAMGRAAGLAGLEPLVRELLSQHPTT
jgi:uncharacterized protein (TIGR01244 family)